MRYLWVAAIGAGFAAGTVQAGPPKLKVPIPSEFPSTLPVPPPAPPIIYVAPPPPPTPYPYARPPQPRGNPGNWVSTADYPSAALRDEISGSTRFRLMIGVDGRVSQCEVIQSSGSAILDSATCSLVTRRARFTPARDGSGALAIGSYTNNIRWVIPVELPPIPGTTKLNFVVGIDGMVVTCSLNAPDGDYDGPSACPTDEFAQPFKDAAGKPVVGRVSQKIDVFIANAPPDPAVRPPAPRRWRSSSDLPLSGTRVTEAIVETDGTVSDCRIVKAVGPLAKVTPVGTNDCPKRYERGYAAADGTAVRTLLRITESTTITLPKADPPKARKR